MRPCCRVARSGQARLAGTQGVEEGHEGRATRGPKRHNALGPPRPSENHFTTRMGRRARAQRFEEPFVSRGSSNIEFESARSESRSAQKPSCNSDASPPMATGSHSRSAFIRRFGRLLSRLALVPGFSNGSLPRFPAWLTPRDEKRLAPRCGSGWLWALGCPSLRAAAARGAGVGRRRPPAAAPGSSGLRRAVCVGPPWGRQVPAEAKRIRRDRLFLAHRRRGPCPRSRAKFVYDLHHTQKHLRNKYSRKDPGRRYLELWRQRSVPRPPHPETRETSACMRRRGEPPRLSWLTVTLASAVRGTEPSCPNPSYSSTIRQPS